MFIRKKNNFKITPLLSGGGQENGLRSGTIPTVLCVGFGQAVELIERERNKNMKKIKELKKIFLDKLVKNKIDFF